MRLTTIVFCSGALLGLCAACAGERAANEPASYQDLKQEELASERDDYIRDTRERLTEVDRDIEHVKAKLEHESKFVDEGQRASWKEDLFELQQERAELGAQLDRASTASPAEWEEMRGTVGTATDALQAGVRKLRVEVSDAVAVNEDATASASQAGPKQDAGLCRVNMADVEADVTRAGNRVTVTLTTDEETNVAELQRRASELAKATNSYEVSRHDAPMQPDPPGTEERPAPNADAKAVKPHGRVDVAVAIEKVEDGAKLTFTPKGAEVEPLRAQLEQEAESLEEGRCQPAEVSMKTSDR
jgi:hypothetical protein